MPGPILNDFTKITLEYKSKFEELKRKTWRFFLWWNLFLIVPISVLLSIFVTPWLIILTIMFTIVPISASGNKKTTLWKEFWGKISALKNQYKNLQMKVPDASTKDRSPDSIVQSRKAETSRIPFVPELPAPAPSSSSAVQADQFYQIPITPSLQHELTEGINQCIVCNEESVTLWKLSHVLRHSTSSPFFSTTTTTTTVTIELKIPVCKTCYDNSLKYGSLFTEVNAKKSNYYLSIFGIFGLLGLGAVIPPFPTLLGPMGFLCVFLIPVVVHLYRKYRPARDRFQLLVKEMKGRTVQNSVSILSNKKHTDASLSFKNKAFYDALLKRSPSEASEVTNEAEKVKLPNDIKRKADELIRQLEENVCPRTPSPEMEQLLATGPQVYCQYCKQQLYFAQQRTMAVFSGGTGFRLAGEMSQRAAKQCPNCHTDICFKCGSSMAVVQGKHSTFACPFCNTFWK